jgi:hypothetical protein
MANTREFSSKDIVAAASPADSNLGQELQCHKAVQLHVFGFVDDTHPAATEFFDDAVM